jgi:hypothetical protein
LLAGGAKDGENLGHVLGSSEVDVLECR